MSERSDQEDSESESTTNREDLEVQLYSLVHYATDSIDAVAAEDTSTEINKSHNQLDSIEKDQVRSTFCVQNPSEAVTANSDHLPANDQNEPIGSEKYKTLKKKCKKSEKIIDYLTLLKEYKTAKAQHNFAEMSRNPSLLWLHKQQNSRGTYRKRYWMKETSDRPDNVGVNHDFDPPMHIFNNSSYSNSRNEENSYRDAFPAAPENAESYLTPQFNGYSAFQDPNFTEYDGRSAAKKLRNPQDIMMNHINHNTNNYEIPYKKKKKKKSKHKKSMQNADIGVSSRTEIIDSSKSAKNQTPKHWKREEQQDEVQKNHVMNHSPDKNFTNDIDSRYSIAPSRKEVDDVIVLESSDGESSIVVLGSPPTPEPPPVICLDSDSENLRHQQELVLNVATPKRPFMENVQGNELKDNNPTNDPSFTSEAVASSSACQVTSREKGHHGMNDHWKWTDKMMSFYNESWGGEHFDVISLQRRMSNNPVKWHVSHRDFQIGFYQKRHKNKCTNCSQFGHAKWHCPEPPRPICCKMCGELGHTEPRCPFPICLQCGERTMVYVRNCRKCRNKTFCTVCNKNGHSHDTCPEVWRKYCTITSSSQVRRGHGPLYKPKEQQWCCVCAKKGHFPEDCQPFYVEPITFQVNNEIHTPKAKKKKKRYMDYHKNKIHSHFGMPC